MLVERPWMASPGLGGGVGSPSFPIFFNLSLNTVSSLGGVMSFNNAVNADSLKCGEIEKVKLIKDDDP